MVKYKGSDKMNTPTFEWDEQKNQSNQKKHGVSFEQAQGAFLDPKRIIIHDEKHSEEEKRLFCIGKVEGTVFTVRFTFRNKKVRILGVAEWRKWRKYYEQENRNI